MARFLLTRLGLAAITLFLLSVFVFVGAQLLPGNVARRNLGTFADQAAVDQLNHELGTDQPILVQYSNWISGSCTAISARRSPTTVPVSELIGPALLNSLKLAAVAFVIVVPLAILGGVFAALKATGLPTASSPSAGSRSPSFPSSSRGSSLIIVFGLWLDLLPVSATRRTERAPHRAQAPVPAGAHPA